MTSFPPDELLTIDVEAELRKLGGGMLEGSWQVPAELVRRAVASGARRIDVGLSRRHVEVRDDGDGVSPGVLRSMALLLDQGLPLAARHAALVALEADGAQPLLALLALAPAAVRLETGGQRLILRPGERPQLQGSTLRERGCRLELSGLQLDAPRASEWLRAVCRFAPGRVSVAGEDVLRGFGETLAEAPLDAPLSGLVALPREGSVALLWLLVDGVVTAHLTLPTAPPIAAVIEMGPRMGAGAGPSAVRDAAEPLLAAIVDQGIRLALEACKALRRRPTAEQRQLRSVLLGAARRRWMTAAVLQAPIFPAVVGPQGHDEAWRSLLELGPLAAGGKRTPLWALEPQKDPRGFLLPAADVLLLDADERSRVAELLGVSFRTPQPRPHATGLRPRLRDGWAAAARALRALAGLLAGTPAPLPAAAWTQAERAFAAALLPAIAVDFSPGAGRVRRVSSGRWRLPRRNPRVAAALQAVAEDPRWIYPAALALLEGSRLPPASLRQAWWAAPAQGSPSA
jgi:hypothetical protein